MDRLERAVGVLLERLGEEPLINVTSHTSRSTIRQDINRAVAPRRDISPGFDGDLSVPPAPPVMIIRDLASDMGVKSPEVTHSDASVDRLISPTLALTLITM